MTYHALKYLACMLSSALVIATLGAAAAWFGGHLSDLSDLVPRVALLMGVVCVAGAWLIFRPIERYLSSGMDRAPPGSSIRRLPLLSGLWVFLLAALTIGGHLGAAHASWGVIAAAGGRMIGTMAAHVALFAAYIGLYVYFLLIEYTAGLRLELWRSRGLLVPPGQGRILTRVLLGFSAVTAGPVLLVASGQAAVSARMPDAGAMESQHALLRQALELDLLAAALFTVMLVILVANSVARPVRLLVDAMQRVDHGELAARAAIVSDDELGTLTSRFNTMLDGLAQQERMRRTFGRFVPAEVAATLLAEEGAIAPQEREATVLFTDIEGFTRLASELQPREVLAMLNDYFGNVAAIIHGRGGVITQFQGDAVLAVFNLPAPLRDHARRAVEAGIEILKVMPRTRVGISTGRVVGGTVGGGDRLGYTVHGDTVNLAARLEAMNKDFGSRILIDGYTAERLSGETALRDRGTVAVRGLPVPVRVCEPLIDVKA